MTGDAGTGADFEAFLRGVAPASPDPVWRERVRAHFLGPASRAGPRSRMESVMASRGSRSGDPTDSDFEHWLRQQPPSGAPSPAFRERNRRRFVAGALAEADPRALSPEPGPHVRGWRRWLVPALAAAAIVAVTWILPEPQRWKARLDGPARFAGTEYEASEGGRLAADLERSGLLESREAPVRLVLAGTLELELRAGSQLELPPLPELDGLTPVDLFLERGEVYVRTGPTYPGNPILITTPDGRVEVLGTTLGVLCEGQGTCVCVAEGTVAVVSPLLAGGVQRLPAPRALFLYRDSERLPEQTAFSDMPDGGGAHVADLAAFQASARD